MGSTGRDVHIDVPLSNIAIAYRPDNMIADQICPIVPVNKQSDGFYIWDIADAFRTENDKRAPATEANVITRSVSSGTYFADNYALKDKIPYEDLENADAGYVFNERSSRVEFVKDKLMLNWELRTVQLVTSGSNVGSYSAVGSAWTDHVAGNSNPINDINTAINNVEDLTGYKANSIVFGRKAWREFREHADVISRLYGNALAPTGSARIVTINGAKALFEVDKVLIGGAYYNTAEEGQSNSLSAMWGDHVLIYYVPLRPRKDRPSFMYGFRWNKIASMQAEIRQNNLIKAEEIELGYYQDEKITASNLAFLITNVTSST